MKKGKPSSIRVISGALKGRAITMVESDSTRSTKSILKESFFNTLGVDVLNSVFVEVFAGTGSMGIEALSRGARRAVFLEYSSVAYKILRQNIENLALEKSSESYYGDSFVLLPSIFPSLSRETNVILYFDPPFSIRDGHGGIYDRIFTMIENLPQSTAFALIAIEHMSELDTPLLIGKFSLVRTRKFGKSSISYYAKL